MSNFDRLILVAALFAVLTGPAHAYIDPGSGSMIVQGVIAAIAALGITAKLWWHRLLVLLGIRKRKTRDRDGTHGGVGK